jgi:hypothetical protein
VIGRDGKPGKEVGNSLRETYHAVYGDDFAEYDALGVLVADHWEIGNCEHT